MFHSDIYLFFLCFLFWSHSSTTHSCCVYGIVSCVGDDALEVACSSGSAWRPRGCLCVNLVSQCSDSMGSYLHISYYSSEWSHMLDPVIIIMLLTWCSQLFSESPSAMFRRRSALPGLKQARLSALSLWIPSVIIFIISLEKYEFVCGLALRHMHVWELFALCHLCLL